jgi:hypothetical protein
VNAAFLALAVTAALNPKLLGLDLLLIENRAGAAVCEVYRGHVRETGGNWTPVSMPGMPVGR